MGFRYRFERCLRWIRILVITISMAFAFGACDESLPPVVEPANILSTSLSLKLGTNHYVVLTGGETPLGSDGAIDVTVTNLYNDVLADSEMIQVQTVIYQTSHPERRDTVYGTREDVQDPSMLLGTLLAIPPRKQLEVLTQWSHKFNGDRPFWTAPDSVLIIGVSGKNITLYKVTFTVSAHVKIFKTRPTQVIDDQEFTVYYRS